MPCCCCCCYLLLCTDSKGQCMWNITLPATKADAKKNYTITITSNKYGKINISDVMFGDVWICSGQSNMQFSVSQVWVCMYVCGG